MPPDGGRILMKRQVTGDDIIIMNSAVLWRIQPAVVMAPLYEQPNVAVYSSFMKSYGRYEILSVVSLSAFIFSFLVLSLSFGLIHYCSTSLHTRRNLIIPGAVCVWRRKPQLGRKNVALLSALLWDSKSRGLLWQAFSGQRTYRFVQPWCNNDRWCIHNHSNWQRARQTGKHVNVGQDLFRVEQRSAVVAGVVRFRAGHSYNYCCFSTNNLFDPVACFYSNLYF
jgi:hypothetical protein